MRTDAKWVLFPYFEACDRRHFGEYTSSSEAKHQQLKNSILNLNTEHSSEVHVWLLVLWGLGLGVGSRAGGKGRGTDQSWGTLD